ncbi:MAG TPA: hypothetical protein VF739_04780 [Ktedonobacterales bacterium]
MAQNANSVVLNLQPLQWNRLDHIAEVEPISDADGPCLEEIRQVLVKYGALSRFGVTLLHSHFSLSDDEIMMETTDLDSREQRVRPVSRSWLDAEGVTAQTTVVSFDENGYNQNCGCDPRSTGHHHK